MSKPVSKEDLRKLRKAVKSVSRTVRGAANLWKWSFSLTKNIGK